MLRTLRIIIRVILKLCSILRFHILTSWFDISSFPSVPVIETDDAGQSYTYISEDLRETLLSMAINEYEITATDIPLNIPTATFVFELISFCGGESYTEFIVGESVTEFRLTFDSNGRHILSLITSEGESRTVSTQMNRRHILI